MLQDALLAAPVVRTQPAGSPFYRADPLYQLHFYARAPRTRRVLAQLSATYRFSDALSLSVRGSREQADARELGYSPDLNTASAPVPTVAETSTSTTNTHNWVADAALRYQRTFGDRHALTASLTYLRQQYE